MKKIVIASLVLLAVYFSAGMPGVKALDGAAAVRAETTAVDAAKDMDGSPAEVIAPKSEGNAAKTVEALKVSAAEAEEESFRARNYIFIGDSRTVNLSLADTDYTNLSFLCKESMAYNYMTKIFPKALEQCDPDKENIIVSWFGINNVGEIIKYVQYYNTVSLPDNVRLVVLSITDGYSGRKPIGIDEFNGLMQDNAENYTYVDITDKVGNGKQINVTDSARLHYTTNADELLQVIINKLKKIN